MATKDIKTITLPNGDVCKVQGYCLVLTKSSVSSLPATITDSAITADHYVINSTLSNPSAQTGDWTVTTSAESLTISGNISGTTDITLYLMKGA